MIISNPSCPVIHCFFPDSMCLYVLLLGVFDVLAYTDKDVAVPFTWIESDPKLIANPQMVKLHSFDTKVRFYNNGNV